MAAEKHWHLVCYDIRDPKRWRRAYKALKGRGDRLQYSIFRVRMTKIQLEALRYDLAKILEDEDDLMIIKLCHGCATRIIDSTGTEKWTNAPASFEIF